MSTDDPGLPSMSKARSDRSRPATRARPRRGLGLEITAVVIAGLLAIGVVIAALDMKFQADQARWQQRQTCLSWYRLQADYGLGPWYEKLPVAAADCGGTKADDGTQLVPGGNQPAINPSEAPAAGATSTTMTVDSIPSTAPGSSGP